MTRLARDAGVPIIPVGVTGTAEVLPVDARLPADTPSPCGSARRSRSPNGSTGRATSGRSPTR